MLLEESACLQPLPAHGTGRPWMALFLKYPGPAGGVGPPPRRRPGQPCTCHKTTHDSTFRFSCWFLRNLLLFLGKSRLSQADWTVWISGFAFVWFSSTFSCSPTESYSLFKQFKIPFNLKSFTLFEKVQGQVLWVQQRSTWTLLAPLGNRHICNCPSPCCLPKWDSDLHICVRLTDGWPILWVLGADWAPGWV